MDHLRAAIGLEGYGQKDPKMRYKEEAFKLFVQMQELVRQDLTKLFFRVQIKLQTLMVCHQRCLLGPVVLRLRVVPPATWQPVASSSVLRLRKPRQNLLRPCRHRRRKGSGAASASAVADLSKLKPDDPCPCGSGRPYGQCHGVFDSQAQLHAINPYEGHGLLPPRVLMHASSSVPCYWRTSALLSPSFAWCEN